MNIFAMTGAERSNPEYISVNRSGDGYAITVRNPGKSDGTAGSTASIALEPSQARKLATDLLAELDTSNG